MRVAIACDHGGLPLKQSVIATVQELGFEAIDLGAFDCQSDDDYPDYAAKTGREIQAGRVDRGILICGSGVGASIAANKMKGIYAAVCHDTYSAHQGVEHDDMNMLCLGARIIGDELAKELVRSFLMARFSNEERHVRRVGKVRIMEEELENEGGKK
jgi:ribose 5-phosphate isomerase B